MGGNTRNDLRRWQWWLALLANWALVPFAWLTYRGGGPVWGAYLLIQAGTIWLNDKASGSRWSLAFLCANLTAATAIAGMSSWGVMLTPADAEMPALCHHAREMAGDFVPCPPIFVFFRSSVEIGLLLSCEIRPKTFRFANPVKIVRHF